MRRVGIEPTHSTSLRVGLVLSTYLPTHPERGFRVEGVRRVGIEPTT